MRPSGSGCALFLHARLQYFAWLRASVDGRRYIGFPHRSHVTFGYRFGSTLGVWLYTPTYCSAAVIVHVVTFWESARVNPGDHVADFKPGVFDPHGHPVLGARASERQQVAARLEHSQALCPDFNAGHIAVPLMTHKSASAVSDANPRTAVWAFKVNAADPAAALFVGRESIRRIGHDAVNAVAGHCAHYV